MLVEFFLHRAGSFLDMAFDAHWSLRLYGSLLISIGASDCSRDAPNSWANTGTSAVFASYGATNNKKEKTNAPYRTDSRSY